MSLRLKIVAALLLGVAPVPGGTDARAKEGKGSEPALLRTPDRGIQPQVAVDASGNVYVFWHAPEPGKTGEGNRKVWVAVSTDEGKTFSTERAATREPTGACGCCGMRAFADARGRLYALYRGAKDLTQRDMHL